MREPIFSAEVVEGLAYFQTVRVPRSREPGGRAAQVWAARLRLFPESRAAEGAGTKPVGTDDSFVGHHGGSCLNSSLNEGMRPLCSVLLCPAGQLKEWAELGMPDTPSGCSWVWRS